MRNQICTAMVLAACMTSTIAPANAAGMMQRIVNYECKQANQDKLLFKCEVDLDGSSAQLVFRYSAKPDEVSGYRQDVLVKRFFDAGGMHVRIVDLAGKRYQSCSRPADRRYFLVCESWQQGE